MKKSAVLCLLAFLLGYCSYALFNNPNPYGKEEMTAHHWKLVDAYRKHMSDSANERTHPDGLVGIQEPFPIEPSVTFLAAVGELKHVDLVLPTVPRKTKFNRHWMEFVNQRSEKILYGTGNPEYVDFKPTGDSPMRFQLWFRPEATEDIRRLIRELEALAAKEKQ